MLTGGTAGPRSGRGCLKNQSGQLGTMNLESINSDPQSDYDLMRAVAAGDPEALGHLYTRHRQRVLTLAYRTLGHWSLAEDITHETFLRVRQAAAGYRPQADFTTWLYRIVVNLCLDEKRRCKRRALDPFQGPDGVSRLAAEPDDGDETRELCETVWKALAKLSRRQRQALILHKIKGLNHARIAEQTGWSQAAVESLIVRAYRKLRKELRNPDP